MKKTILIGVKNNTIITTNLEITERNGYPEFTASFNIGEAFNIDRIDEDYRWDYYESLWDDCYNAESKLDLLNDGNYTKRDVFRQWDAENCNDYHKIIDCSCTDYEITNNNITINFETIGCGQHDIRDDDDFQDMHFTNEKLFNDIMYYWDNYHLKEINNEQIEEIKKLMESNFTEYSSDFNDFVINNIDWVVLNK